jgi:hypothetical protein
MTDEERLQWEIKTVRESIDLDWARLASKDLSPDDRKAVKEHLLIYVSTLQDLVARNRAASQKWKIEKFHRITASTT